MSSKKSSVLSKCKACDSQSSKLPGEELPQGWAYICIQLADVNQPNAICDQCSKDKEGAKAKIMKIWEDATNLAESAGLRIVTEADRRHS
jgi:hypothetical protein